MYPCLSERLAILNDDIFHNIHVYMASIKNTIEFKITNTFLTMFYFLLTCS